MATASDYRLMMQELSALLAAMQADDLDVDAALENYKRGTVLIGELEKYLRTAENRIVQYKLDAPERASEH